ncbi:HAD family hydrolase [Salinirubellus salinus]|uniref:HAD family hydrolase n=1 Tax=Salinirubellus salinus TaxID=1364945 RepID=A0A9E7R3X9_9EURY|nr:HAD family hydrolase [Salinirubellus salinus]UWM54323.1 HAD family hydrolase [Salinirubellus salinus]
MSGTDPLQAVCFDLDDTLYPYAEYARTGLRAAADRLAARTGRGLHTELEWLYFEADVTEGTFDRLLERHGLSAELVDELVEAYHGATADLSPYDETPAVLERVGRTHDLGLVTDGRNGRQKLTRLGLDGRFDAVLVTPTIGSSKHEVEPFERVLDDLGVGPGRAVYVGDDPRVDFRVPNDLGMRTVRVRRGRYTDLEPGSAAAAPDHEIHRLATLPDLLERLGQPVDTT